MKTITSYESNVAPILIAKTCGSSCQKNSKVVYSFADDTNQIFFVDKSNIINNQLDACQRLLPYVSEVDRALVEKEILEPKMVLNPMQ
jgi:hypothetical protein